MNSLFEKNRMNWGNGRIADLVQGMADLEPGFMRFPGGCIVESPPAFFSSTFRLACSARLAGVPWSGIAWRFAKWSLGSRIASCVAVGVF